MGADFGLFGLGRIGGNLARNALSKGMSVSLFDCDPALRSEIGSEFPASLEAFAADDESFAASIGPPRVILFTRAPGDAIDGTIARFIPCLDPGDIVVDAGDSWFRASERRERDLASRGLRFVSLGISGGAEGVLQGPSLMAGGAPELRPILLPIFERLAAKGPDGQACAVWHGPAGAGHFVKMMHNAIEYADMEILAESYNILKSSLRASHREVKACFSKWERSEIASHLLSLSVDVLSKDEADGVPLIDRILDRATQKGSGIRAIEYALELGVQASTLAEAVFARNLSMHKDERVTASALLGEHVSRASGSPSSLMEDVKKAALAAKIIAYSEGFSLLSRASEAE